jgi:cation transport ATPase
MTDTTYRIDGMHCGACTGRVQKALLALGATAEVTLTPPQVRLRGAAVPARDAVAAAVAAAGKYTLGPEIAAPRPASSAMEADAESTNWFSTYQPLLLIVAYIAVASFASTGPNPAAGTAWSSWMTNFMAGFFLVFSFFKFLDLRGFADAYSTYDLLAARWRTWGFIYPFLELGLGLAYLFRVAPFATNLTAILLMGFSSLGVIAALRRRQQIRCACLGTVLKLPMSTITLVEDLGMVAMAAMALATGH